MILRPVNSTLDYYLWGDSMKWYPAWSSSLSPTSGKFHLVLRCLRRNWSFVLWSGGVAPSFWRLADIKADLIISDISWALHHDYFCNLLGLLLKKKKKQTQTRRLYITYSYFLLLSVKTPVDSVSAGRGVGGTLPGVETAKFSPCQLHTMKGWKSSLEFLS